MKNTVVAEYDYYTLEQARKLIYAEMRHDRITRKRKLANKRLARRKRMIEQIKFGLFLFGAFIVLPLSMIAHYLMIGY